MNPDIERVLDLMDATDTDILGVWSYALLNTRLFNVPDATLLSWLPDDIAHQVLVWLEEKRLDDIEAELTGDGR